MRNNDEFRQEIFRRSHETIKRRKRIRGILAACIPLVLVAAMLPGLASQKNSDNAAEVAPDREMALAPGKQDTLRSPEDADNRFVEVKYQGSSHVITDRNLIRAIGDIVAAADAESPMPDSPVTLDCSFFLDGREYGLSGTLLYCMDTQTLYPLAPETAQILLELLTKEEIP